MISRILMLTIFFFGMSIGLFFYNIIAIIRGNHFHFRFHPADGYDLEIEIDRKKNPKKFWFNTILIFYISIVLAIFGTHGAIGSTDPFEFYFFPVLVSFVIIAVIATFIWRRLD